MIKLEKLEEPQILVKHKAKWTADYVNARAAGGKVPDTVASRYKHPDIKARIVAETHEKCAYCESKITQTYPGDVEHLIPKSVVPEFVVEWSNLTLACWQCNHNKADYYDPHDPLLNPYENDPDDYLVAIGPFVFARPTARLGRITELTLDLNRGALMERRSERIFALRQMANEYANEKNARLREILRRELLKETYPDREYAFISRSFILNVCGTLEAVVEGD
jgi:HNH endonuclease